MMLNNYLSICQTADWTTYQEVHRWLGMGLV